MRSRVIAIAAIGGFLLHWPSRGHAMDAISREVSVYNNLAPPPIIGDAISREVSVLNNLATPPTIADAVSREVSVHNNLTPPPVITDTVSREVSVYNDLINPVSPRDAVSREVSVRNRFGCPPQPDTDQHGFLSGNLTDDGLVTLADLVPFVNVLVTLVNDPYLRQASDMNCDGNTNGRDIQLFVNEVLSP